MAETALTSNFADAARHFGAKDNEPIRLAAARLAVERSQMLIEAGWRLMDWRPTTKHSPFTRTVSYGRGWLRYWDARIVHRPWFDHPYRLVNDDGRTLFCVEPYDVDPKMIQELCEYSEAHNLDFDISTACAIHFPGWTTRLSFEHRR